jgi:ankyrin repeat protein
MGCGSSSTAQPDKPVPTIKTAKEVQVASSSAETESPTASPSKGLIYQAAVDNSSNLFAAIKRGDVLATNELVSSSGGDANKLVGMWGSTPLIVALQYGQKEIAERLLREEELGDLNHINEKGASSLLYACMEGMTDIVSSVPYI